VLFVGINPVVSHGHGSAVPDPVTTIRNMRSSGADVWVLDPRLTETARLAGHHLAPRPGTDHAVLAHLTRELLRDGARRDVPVRGLEELAAAVEPYDADHTAQLAGVPVEQLDELVAAARAAGPVSVHTGTGVTMAPAANVTAWLAWVVPILTGAMNQPGGMWFHPGFAHQFETFELPVMPPDALFGPGPSSRPETQSFLGEWPCAVIPDEIRAGNMKAFLNLGGHLATAFPDTNVMMPALESLEVFATVEIIENETTAASTHVLPTKDQLEREDLTLWDFITPRVAAMHTPPVVEPVGDRRSGWWVLAELGRRLGYDLGDVSRSDSEVLAATLSRARATFDDVVAAGYLELPNEVPAPWVDAHVERAGGWQLAPPILIEQLAALEPPPPLSLVPRRQARRLNSALAFLGERPEVLLHPDDATEAGLTDGQEVVVRTDRGELSGVTRIDPHIRRGAVSVPHGHEGANVNRLTSKDELDLVTGMVQYAVLPVTLHPA
jgi:anaerobic selenocysteine-containing dehydrogenase